MDYRVVPNAEKYFEGLHAALDTVAREARFLAFLEAPPLAQALAFYRHIVANDLCQFVAVADDVVVGWCDVVPLHGQARAHVGNLGMGLVPSARHRGLGAALLTATIAGARARGITRIQLTVRTDNANAKALYERFGFETEGIQRKSLWMLNRYHDAFAMSLLS